MKSAVVIFVFAALGCLAADVSVEQLAPSDQLPEFVTFSDLHCPHSAREL